VLNFKEDNMGEYKVYVRTNGNGVIIAVNSSAFLSDTEGWTVIDEGTGDKYHHAQGNYLPNRLTDDNGLYNYKLVDGRVVERTDEDKAPELAKINAANEIAELKAKLTATDYIAAKIAEGAAAKEDYAAEIAQRAAWRERINELGG
jgi:hypothetical protein